MSNSLEIDCSILEKNLKFVKNQFEEKLEQVFVDSEQNHNVMDSKLITPIPGMCIKFFKVNSNEKFFINICQASEMPAPEDISEDELIDILQSDIPSSYKIPMSISEPRSTTDKAGNDVEVCDVAINVAFFEKCERSSIFREFIIIVLLEALSEKYNVQLNSNNFIVLKNRKFLGTLVTHRIRNTDVKKAYKQILNKVESTETAKKLIQEIDPKQMKSFKKSVYQKQKHGNYADTVEGFVIPNSQLLGKVQNNKVKEIFAEFYLPDCICSSDINLEIGENRILIHSAKGKYRFDKFIEYKVDQDQVFAHFDDVTKILHVSMHVVK